jgi:AcrR family transcriptional regulator
VGRPRGFEESEVVDRALEVFFEKGFEGTSITDLEEATGLGRASLYGAFGDKEALFERVITLFAERAGRCSMPDASKAAPLDRLRGLMEAQLAGACPTKGPRGCFLQISSQAAGPAGDRARAAYDATRRATLRVLETVLEDARARGELKPATDPRVAARFLHTVMQGVAASARAGVSARELRPVIDQALSGL